MFEVFSRNIYGSEQQRQKLKTQNVLPDFTDSPPGSLVLHVAIKEKSGKNNEPYHSYFVFIVAR
jgi:hypothetical protein